MSLHYFLGAAAAGAVIGAIIRKEEREATLGQIPESVRQEQLRRIQTYMNLIPSEGGSGRLPSPMFVESPHMPYQVPRVIPRRPFARGPF